MDGHIVVEVYPAGPRGWWDRSLHGWWARITRSTEWWLDAQTSESDFAVRRERFDDESAARSRADDIIAGRVALATRPAWRRVHG